MKSKILIIDFDSTFVEVESLDELANIALRGRKDKDKIFKEITEITKLGMEGKLTFPQSLTRRLQLFQPNAEHLKELTMRLMVAITPSILRNKKFFQEHTENIYILSGGFREYMLPVLKHFGIPEGHILANTFLFDKKGYITGHDTDNPLAQEKGKVKVVQGMNFNGDIHMIGDGYTDWEIKEAGLVKKFIAFTENVTRDVVVKRADYVAHSFEEVLKIL